VSALSAAPPKKDGRRERSARTRRAIIAALLDLVQEGRLEPSALEIAGRAGVAERSIRQHFASREELFVAAVEEHTRRVAAPVGGIDPRLGLAERIAAFAEVRARELELCAPVRLATNAVQAASAAVAPKGRAARPTAIARATDAAWQRRRREVERVFEKEIAASAEPEALLDALDLATHGQTWDTMRYAMRLERADATALVRRNLAALLASRQRA
jgi:AcrR family transcriptional regulator